MQINEMLYALYTDTMSLARCLVETYHVHFHISPQFRHNILYRIMFSLIVSIINSTTSTYIYIYIYILFL